MLSIPRRFVVVSLVMAALVLAAPSTSTPAVALTNCDVADQTMDLEENAFLVLINNYRAQNLLSPLTVSVNLNRAASWLAVDMATKNYFSHTDSLGRDAATRGSQCGTASGIGENIAAGSSWDTAQEAFDAWKASPGHDANMLLSGYKQIGIARYYSAASTYKWYWVTDFSLYDDGTLLLSGSVGTTPTAVPPTATPTRTPVASTSTPPPTATAIPPTATATPASSPAKATMISPTPGSRLSGTQVTFSWTAVSGASQYRLQVGTTAGGSEVYDRTTTSRSATVRNLPRGGITIYVRLWTLTGSGWQFNDYQYTAAR